MRSLLALMLMVAVKNFMAYTPLKGNKWTLYSMTENGSKKMRYDGKFDELDPKST